MARQDRCDTCGDIGDDEFLLTCTLCNCNREHVYCLRIALDERIDDWLCEECESKSKQNTIIEYPVVPRLKQHEEVHNGGERAKLNESRNRECRLLPERRVATGKTKCLSVNEAIKLSSKGSQFKCRSKVSYYSKFIGPNTGASTSRKTFATTTCGQLLKLSSQQDIASSTLRQSNAPKTLAVGNNLQLSKVPNGKHMQKEQLAKVQLPPSHPRFFMATQPSSSIQSQSNAVAFLSGHDCSTMKPNCSDASMSKSNLHLAKVSRSPAKDALWKGRFRIQDGHTCEELNQLQAHPPSRVGRKIYEFAQQMPEVLQFQLVPLKKFWIKFFNEDAPDETDIGLYFFPRERNAEYIFLLDTISLKNMALRKQIADVELLVFSSKLLPVNCRFWGGNDFLWGVFHHLKPDTKGNCRAQQW